jgi:hypothetical protein
MAPPVHCGRETNWKGQLRNANDLHLQVKKVRVLFAVSSAAVRVVSAGQVLQSESGCK